MPSLHIRSEDTGDAWQVWPSADSIPSGTIQETRSYIFELQDAEGAPDTDLLIDDVPLEALRSSSAGTARWRWQTGFHAGEISAELRPPGQRPIRFELVTDPDRNKLTRSDFNTMLVDIMRDSFALFSLTNFHKGIAQGTKGKPPAIARLEYLRSRMDALERVVREIQRRPRRHLRSEERIVPYHQVRRATGDEVTDPSHADVPPSFLRRKRACHAPFAASCRPNSASARGSVPSICPSIARWLRF